MQFSNSTYSELLDEYFKKVTKKPSKQKEYSKEKGKKKDYSKERERKRNQYD